MGIFRKRNRLVSSPSVLNYSTCMLCIDFKTNIKNNSEQIWHRFIFDLPKQNDANVVLQSFPPWCRVNFKMRRNNALPFLYHLFRKKKHWESFSRWNMALLIGKNTAFYYYTDTWHSHRLKRNTKLEIKPDQASLIKIHVV